MRVDIPSGDKPIKDRDIKALHLLNYAMELSSDRMLKANLDFVLNKYQSKIDRSRALLTTNP